MLTGQPGIPDSLVLQVQIQMLLDPRDTLGILGLPEKAEKIQTLPAQPGTQGSPGFTGQVQTLPDLLDTLDSPGLLDLLGSLVILGSPDLLLTVYAWGIKTTAVAVGRDTRT